MRTGSRDTAYKSVKKFFNDYKPKMGALEDNNGVINYEAKHREHMEGVSRVATCGAKTYWTRNRT